MTKRRIGAFLLVMIAIVGAVGCDTAAQDGSPTASSDQSDDKERSSVRAAGAFPDQPKIEIDWQNTVVDVEPTSRFQEPPGGPDTAHFETTLALEEEPDGETQDFLKGLDDTDVEFDGRLVRMTYTMDVEQIDDNRYSFEFDAPVEFAELDKNDDLSVVVLLPRDADDYREVPTYTVQLDEGFIEEFGETFDILEADEAPGNRITIGLYERTDPKIPPIFSYLP